MSIFSRISKSRQQAREHNAKLAEQQKKEDQKTPYRHVPTHAASDAIASAPPGWREADRSRIREENRRRSAMAAAGGSSSSSGHMSMNMNMNMNMMHMNMINMNMNMPGVPRVGSSLSHVSFPTDVNATPMVRLPRSYSYNGLAPLPVMYPPSSHHASQSSREVIYSVPDPGATLYAASGTSSSKGKETVYRPSLDVSRVSPTHLKHLEGDISGSSSGSNSSQDDLDITPVPDGHGHAGRPHKRPSTATTEALHRMRPGRRTSDSSIDRIAMANHARALRDSRPPTSMKPIAPTFPQHRASMPVAYTTTSTILNHPIRNEPENISPTTTASSSPTQEEAEHANEDNEEEEEESFEDAPEFCENQEPVLAEMIAPPPVAPFNADRSKHLRRPPTTALHRFETASSSSSDGRNLNPSYAHYQTAAPASRPAPITQEQVIVNVFPEAAESTPGPETKEKSRRFSRSGSKFGKNRWSTSRNSYPVAV